MLALTQENEKGRASTKASALSSGCCCFAWLAHLEDIAPTFTEEGFVPPAPPVLTTAVEPATGYLLERVPAGWYGEWHPAPSRVLAFYLSGYCRIETSDGEVRPMEPGTILLAEDTTGKGHITSVTGAEEMVVAIVTLPD